MNLTPSFIRKVLYLGAMVPPLVVIVYVGMPAVGGVGEDKSPGGKLAVLRDEHDLSQANLGDIDPASETMKLSTLGLRGVAALALWQQAFHYKSRMNFDKLSATLNQLIKLQPNFIKVWEFQAHNLSYNVSVEFDDYRDRYNWVTKGINFLMSGTRYNRNEPRLASQCGWFTSHKIGRSDEYKQFRRLFRRDTDFHDSINEYVDVDSGKSRVDLLPDNWLVGRLWYLKSEDIVQNAGVPLRGNRWLFYSHSPKCLISFAEALDRDDDLPADEVSQQAWIQAYEVWDKFGDMEFFAGGKRPVVLNALYELKLKKKELEVEIDAIAAGFSDEELADVRKFIREFAGEETEVEELRTLVSDSFRDIQYVRTDIHREKREALKLADATVLDTPANRRTQDQQRRASELEFQIEPKFQDVVEKAPENRRELAQQRLNDYERTLEDLDSVQVLEGHSKYHYWKTRCQVEATDEARAAKRHLFNARRLVEQGSLQKKQELVDGKLVTVNGAKEEFEAAWEQWDKIFSKSPRMYDNVNESQLLLNDLMVYDRVLSQLDLPPLPYDFPLRRLIDLESGSWNGRPLRLKPSDAEDAKNKQKEPADEKQSTKEESPDAKPEGTSADKEAVKEKAPGKKDSKVKPDAKEPPKKQDGKPATESKAGPAPQPVEKSKDAAPQPE